MGIADPLHQGTMTMTDHLLQGAMTTGKNITADRPSLVTGSQSVRRDHRATERRRLEVHTGSPIVASWILWRRSREGGGSRVKAKKEKKDKEKRKDRRHSKRSSHDGVH